MLLELFVEASPSLSPGGAHLFFGVSADVSRRFGKTEEGRGKREEGRGKRASALARSPLQPLRSLLPAGSHKVPLDL
jgi:hypothetical protein